MNGIRYIIKAKNSIEQKLNNYIRNKDEKGSVPINKCFNDILGIRCIMEDKIEFEELRQELKDKFVKIKCISSIRGNYKAIHLYFKNNNFALPWELQIWAKSDEEENLQSHAKYKQGYTKWEADSEGSDSSDNSLYNNE